MEEAARAISAGYAGRMMLEVSPDFSFAVLSPAFVGCEGGLALNIHKDKGCNFLHNQRCELHGTGFQPLECRFCHHERLGLGKQCHDDLAHDWQTSAGKALVIRWGTFTGFWNKWKARS